MEHLIKKIHTSDDKNPRPSNLLVGITQKFKTSPLQLCWREIEAMPNGELLLEPTELLDGHWSDQMETASDVTDIELVEAEKAQRYLMLFIHFNVNNDIFVSTPE